MAANEMTIVPIQAATGRGRLVSAINADASANAVHTLCCALLSHDAVGALAQHAADWTVRLVGALVHAAV